MLKAVYCPVAANGTCDRAGSIPGHEDEQRNAAYFRCVRQTAEIDCYFVVSVCPSSSMEQFDPHWTDFHEIWY